MPYEAKISRVGGAHVATVSITSGSQVVTATIYYDVDQITRGYLIQFARPVVKDGRITIAYEYFPGKFHPMEIEGLQNVRRLSGKGETFTENMIINAIKLPRRYVDPYFAEHIAMASQVGDFFGAL